MEQVLIVLGVVTALVLATTCTVAVLAVRAVRRTYRSARASIAGASTPGWWAAQSRRQRLWRAVTSAERALEVARAADAPVGDLPALTRQVRSAALGVDGVLRASASGGTLAPEDRAACDQVERAAADIRRAALSSARSVSQADTAPLLSAVQIEVAALAAGVRAATR
jgi:hypothetical protein